MVSSRLSGLPAIVQSFGSLTFTSFGGSTLAAASGAVVIAPYAFSGDVLAGRGIFGRDLRPVAFELLGDELGEPGERALTHLGAGDANDHCVVRADHHPGIDLRRTVLRAND